MSIVICEHCDRPVDSDYDMDCFCENPYDSRDVTVICEGCRERAWDRHQEDLMEGGGGPSLQQQAQDAYKIKHGLR